MLESTRTTKALLSGENLFRIKLATTLEQRINRNPNYSLRTYARSLGLNPGCLSTILNNKRKITSKMIKRLGSKLELTDDELIVYLKDEITPEEKWVSLEKDTYSYISQWHNFAILEWLRVVSKEHSSKNISRSLKIAEIEVETSLERMSRLGLITQVATHRYRVEKSNTQIIVTSATSSALRELQTQILKKSQDSLVDDSIKLRYHGSYTLSLDTEQLGYYKELIREFRQKFDQMTRQKSCRPNRVYQLQMSLFPLSQDLES